MIEIIGLGQLFDSLPMRAVHALDRADQIVLQSALGACAQEIMRRYEKVASLDKVYESAKDFDELYVRGADLILEESSGAEHVCFCCFGSPQDNGFVEKLSDRVQVEHAGGTDPAAEAVYLAGGIDGITDYVSFEARTLSRQYIDTSIAAVVVGIDDMYTAASVKIALGEFYPDDFEAALVIDGDVQTVAIRQIDRIKNWAPSGVLVLRALPLLEKERFTYVDALRVMEMLRAPDGCPWDREQTHESLRPYLVEEAYEVSDAVAEGDTRALADELGDVLLQIIFHAQLGREAGEFTDVDVSTALCRKMIRRHPHVFGDAVCTDAGEVLVNWERIKGTEKGAEQRRGALSGIPASMDPLSRAMKLQQKAARVGFDWPAAAGAAEKVREETAEFEHEIAEGDTARLTDEGGDLLFAVINALRKAGVNPQSALQDACRKFAGRFKYIEDHAGRSLEGMQLDAMDALWNEAKEREREPFST